MGESSVPPTKPQHPYRAFAIRIGLGLTVVAGLLWYYNPRPILHTLSRESPAWFAAACGLYLAGQVMSAYRWQLLANLLGLYGPFKEFLAYYFIGVFTNLFVPGLVGGDAARAVYLGRRQARMSEAIASAIADRGLGLVALFWLAALAAIFLNFGHLPRSVTVPSTVVGLLALSGLIAGPYVARLVPLLPHQLKGLAVVTPYLMHPLRLLPAIGLSLLLQISLAICQYMLALGLGLSAPLTLFLLCVPIANVIASVPLTLGGLGLRESAYLVLLGMGGVSKDDAIALGLLWFAATMLVGLTGAIAFVTTPTPNSSSAAPVI
jgi:glycosyltransferase 2 family protein